MRTVVEPRCIALSLTLPLVLVAGALRPAPLLPSAAPQAASSAEVPRQPVGAPLAAEPPVPTAVPAPVALAAPRRPAQRADRAARTRSTRPGVEERGRAALEALPYDAAALGYRIRFVPYRGGELGTTNRRDRLITVYVRPLQSEQVLRTTIAHELGHALDFVHGTTERRNAYREARGLPRSGRWFPCDRCSDFASPAGDFAEVFAMWLAGPGDFRGQLRPAPDAAELRRLAPLFAVPRVTAPAAAASSPSPQPSPSTQKELPPLIPPPPTGTRGGLQD